MRDINKFEKVETVLGEEFPVIKDSLGYMVFEKVDTIKNETRILSIEKLVEADVFQEEAMSYGYYQEHKEELIKVKTEGEKTAWVCTIGGYVYYGEIQLEGFTCLKCGVDGSLFEKK